MRADCDALDVRLLDRDHDKAGFTCGVDTLDRYLNTQAGQDIKRKANAVFALSPREQPTRILGYYTVCSLALEQGHVPEAARKHMPRYPLVSATLIGRLAVATDCQGRGLGSLLLADALKRAYQATDTVGSSMVVVDAIDEPAARFYGAHGFLRLPDSPRLVIPMRLIGRTLSRPRP